MNRRKFLATSGIASLGGCARLAARETRTETEEERTSRSETEERTSQSETEEEHTSRTETGEERTSRTKYAKVDLHAHLSAGGGQAMADRYAELGYDVLVGTDHVDEGPEGSHTYDYSDLDFPGPILEGAELSEGFHVNHIESENEALRQLNHPMRYNLSLGEIRDRVAQVDADLVEVTTHGRKLQQTPTVADVATRMDANPSITSDAHEPEEIGRGGYVVVEVPELTGDGIIRALKRGDYTLGGPNLW